MPTSIRLGADEEKRLDALARRTGRTKAYYLRELIKNGLDELEYVYLGIDTKERIRKGKESVYSEQEMRKAKHG